jgi:hypothetical protein
MSITFPHKGRVLAPATALLGIAPLASRSDGNSGANTSTLLDADHRPITVGLANLNAPQLNQDDLIFAGAVKG